MTDLTPTEAARLAALFAPLKDHPSPYPPELFEAQRAAFLAKIRERNEDEIEARLNQIEGDLRDPFIDRETAYNLLDEMADLINHQGKE